MRQLLDSKVTSRRFNVNTLRKHEERSVYLSTFGSKYRHYLNSLLHFDGIV